MSDAVRQLIEFLGSPDSYLDRTQRIDIIQTHASIVAVGDTSVYKVKKPVHFEFMDFSTLAKRRFYCEEEIRLNRRLTSDIYLDLVPIYRDSDGNLTFINEQGEVAEYAIKMRRMKSQGFLSDLIERGEDHESHYVSIVNKLCQFYVQLRPQTINKTYGTVESIKHIVDENRSIRKTLLNYSLMPIQEEVIHSFQTSFLKKNSALIKSRVEDGWIRDVHGDLRLEHFYFESDHLNIYDCIEFAERLRVNDVVNDVAFLSMELESSGRWDASEKIYNSICQCTGDTINQKLWNFYKLHRACVRGMVHSIASKEAEVDPPDRQRNLLAGKKMFGLATRYAVCGLKPIVIVVYGGTATGKTTVAGSLSKILNIPHLQSDIVRKEMFGIAPEQYPDSNLRDIMYTPESTRKTYLKVIEKAKDCIQNFQAVILDSRWTSENLRQLIKDNFDAQDVLWVKVVSDIEVRKQRLLQRESTDSVSDARIDVLDKLLIDEEGYRISDVENLTVVDTSIPGEHSADLVRKLYSHHREVLL